MAQHVLDLLKERGFIAQMTFEDELYEQLKNPTTFYVGFDPTADSLHIGHYIPIMAMAHMQRAGHRPFALMGGTCRVQGVGDFLKALPPVPECWFTVVMPDYGVSTPEAFAAYDKVGSSIHPDCGAQEAAIRAGDLDALCAAAGNALEECSGAKDTGAIKALLREHGAVTALMTGSGAAVFGVFRDEGAARAAAQAAKRRWKQVYVAQPDRGGARVSR